MMKKLVLPILVLAMLSAVALAQCPGEGCAPYLTVDVRGVLYDHYSEYYCYYNDSDSRDVCGTLVESANDRWNFENLSCTDASCIYSCVACDSLGGNCAAVLYGDYTDACNDAPDGCDCPLFGPEAPDCGDPEVCEDGEVCEDCPECCAPPETPELTGAAGLSSTTTALIAVLAVAVVVMIVVMRRK